ncbi:MAG: xanthine phosphoribosyltransferase [Clostridia bacterium]|nr:xanthine phosphoribosyltransferase [Clostridia bacterium]MBR3681337.1 xanthine phosphoribosyltransferase [Clostridia bacterium]
MKLLEDRIRRDGRILPGDVIKVDSFLNHLIDVELVSACADEWYNIYKDMGVTKILTIEASGIALASITATKFSVPVLFAKKTRSSNLSQRVLSTKVVSYTHGQSYDVIVSRDYIKKEDKILIIDDFLANGSALRALVTLAEKAGATVLGIGIAVEKVYQGGGEDIRRRGYRIDSLAKIKSVDVESGIEFYE